MPSLWLGDDDMIDNEVPRVSRDEEEEVLEKHAESRLRSCGEASGNDFVSTLGRHQ